ncbi:glycosyltransferase family protein [Egbenema bharatensis]|uniref:glycosyltransferase family protein n=1 Tax=Egbenema bharatensis TaxID=3463334 RepID=UPI003A848C8F
MNPRTQSSPDQPDRIPSEMPQDVPLQDDLRDFQLRIALYSHDTMGLGHKRRNLLIAQTLAQSLPHASILLISGMVEGREEHLPQNIDYLALPALHKSIDGKYYPRRLELSLQELVAIRSQVIQAALGTFAPDLFVVDNVPRGAVRELNPALEQLRAGGKTRCVLGLRDVLDEPGVVTHEWRRTLNEEAIRQYYDGVWVYGDRTVFDLVQEYQFAPDIAAKMRYTGYFDQRQRLQFTETSAESVTASSKDGLQDLNLPAGKLALCLVGGGQDGAQLALRFAQAVLPEGMNGVIITGPFMPVEVQQQIQQYAASHPRLRILTYVNEPAQLLDKADCLVSMGGYNTTCEVMSFGKRSLIVPRVAPRLEQWIRAKRLHELGWVDVQHPDRVSSDSISQWLAQEQTSPVKLRSPIDLNGLSRLPKFALDILQNSANPSQPDAPFHLPLNTKSGSQPIVCQAS